MSRPLLVTANPELLEDLLRLTAAAGAEPDVAADATAARHRWTAAPLILVGSDRCDALVAAGLPRREDVVLVTADLDDASVWRRGVEVGAQHVVCLPDADDWLVARITESLTPGGGAKVVGVIGGRGGAGATSTAIALGYAGVRRGLRTVLIDGDPLGGGVDLALAAEGLPGARWPDLGAGASLGALPDVLPSVSDLAVLSHHRQATGRPEPHVVTEVLRAARRAAELVVVDLPRAADDATRALLTGVRVALVVVPAEVLATSAASRVAAYLAAHVGDIRVVVRSATPERLPAAVLAEILGLPLAGVLRDDRDLVDDLDHGVPPGLRARGSLARFAGSFVADLVDAAA